MEYRIYSQRWPIAPNGDPTSEPPWDSTMENWICSQRWPIAPNGDPMSEPPWYSTMEYWIYSQGWSIAQNDDQTSEPPWDSTVEYWIYSQRWPIAQMVTQRMSPLGIAHWKTLKMKLRDYFMEHNRCYIFPGRIFTCCIPTLETSHFNNDSWKIWQISKMQYLSSRLTQHSFHSLFGSYSQHRRHLEHWELRWKAKQVEHLHWWPHLLEEHLKQGKKHPGQFCIVICN